MNEQPPTQPLTCIFIVPGTPVSKPFTIVLHEPLPVHAARVIADAARTNRNHRPLTTQS